MTRSYNRELRVYTIQKYIGTLKGNKCAGRYFSTYLCTNPYTVLQCSQAVWVVKDTACFCAGLRSARLPWHKLDGKTWFWIFFICYFASFAGLHYSLSHFKRDKRFFKKSLVKSSDNNFVFLPAFYLIIWVMTSLKVFLKTTILKIWQLVFFWGIKTHFGEK